MPVIRCSQRLAAVVVATVLALPAAVAVAPANAAPVNGAPGAPPVTVYEVTVRNLTDGQPFSPPVAATHAPSLHVFQVGQPASDEVAAVAQDGDPVPLATTLGGDPAVTDVVNVGRPLPPRGTSPMGFTDNASFRIEAVPGDVLSLATMLICTNDGLTGVDAVALPASGTATFDLVGYDAGRERNTEVSTDLVDPCTGLGPVALPGDPDGNVDDAVATTPPEPIAMHPGIAGVGELVPAEHQWSDPVAQVTVTRSVDAFVDDDDSAMLTPSTCSPQRASSPVGAPRCSPPPRR